MRRCACAMERTGGATERIGGGRCDRLVGVGRRHRDCFLIISIVSGINAGGAIVIVLAILVFVVIVVVVVVSRRHCTAVIDDDVQDAQSLARGDDRWLATAHRRRSSSSSTLGAARVSQRVVPESALLFSRGRRQRRQSDLQIASASVAISIVVNAGDESDRKTEPHVAFARAETRAD